MFWETLLLLLANYVSGVAVTEAEKIAILNKHNELRAFVATPCSASDMETLVWDDTLASDASTYADGCVGDHASGAGTSFGENLWMQFPTSTYYVSNVTDGVQSWYDEIVDVNWTKDSNDTWIEAQSKSGTGYPVACQNPDIANGNCYIGHFTQIVWAKSNKIGCGIKSCTGGFMISGVQHNTGVLLVCRYTPAGNTAAAPNSPNHFKMPFTAGAQCASCPGAACSTAGICNAGASVTRCGDKAPPYDLHGVSYQTCSAYVAGIDSTLTMLAPACTSSGASSLIAGNCEAHCGKCSVPTNLGKDYCEIPTTSTTSTTGTTVNVTNSTTVSTTASTSTSVELEPEPDLPAGGASNGCLRQYDMVLPSLAILSLPFLF